MLARRFLWVVAILVFLGIAGLVTYFLFGVQIIRAALTPSAPYSLEAAGPAPDYSNPASWAAHPERADDPSRWTPDGMAPNAALPAALPAALAAAPQIATFYIAPTSFFDRSRWNAPYNDASMNEQSDKFLRLQASLFNASTRVWAPKYRQATFGTFLAPENPAAPRAIDLAYSDVDAAFTAFLESQPEDAPFILAGHSQGSLHLYRLLAERVAGTPLAGRVIAAYAPGWPLSVEADLPAMGLPACTAAAQTGCLLSWQSFADPADIAPIRETFENGAGYTGQPRAGTTMLCTNPMSGITNTAPVDMAQNLGSLVPNTDFTGGSLVAKGLGAQCMPDDRLSIGEAPAEFTAFILPGNNFHVYDYPLFWANLREDVIRRTAAAMAAATAAPAPEAP